MPKKKAKKQSKKGPVKKATTRKSVKSTPVSRTRKTAQRANMTTTRHSIAPHIIMWLILALVVFFLLFLFSRIFNGGINTGRLSQEERQIQQNKAYLEANITPITAEVREAAVELLNGN